MVWKVLRFFSSCYVKCFEGFRPKGVTAPYIKCVIHPIIKLGGFGIPTTAGIS